MSQQILIVDDSQSVRKSMRYVIENEGYDVIEAANGKEALEALTPRTNLVITDINMPEMNGIDLVLRVRSGAPSCRSIPIVVLTTESQPEMKQKGRDAGATAWMVKPFSPQQMVEVIKRVIG